MPNGPGMFMERIEKEDRTNLHLQTSEDGLYLWSRQRSTQKKILKRPRTHLLLKGNITSSIWVELAMYLTQERLN